MDAARCVFSGGAPGSQPSSATAPTVADLVQHLGVSYPPATISVPEAAQAVLGLRAGTHTSSVVNRLLSAGAKVEEVAESACGLAGVSGDDVDLDQAGLQAMVRCRGVGWLPRHPSWMQTQTQTQTQTQAQTQAQAQAQA